MSIGDSHKPVEGVAKYVPFGFSCTNDCIRPSLDPDHFSDRIPLLKESRNNIGTDNGNLSRIIHILLRKVSPFIYIVGIVGKIIFISSADADVGDRKSVV